MKKNIAIVLFIMTQALMFHSVSCAALVSLSDHLIYDSSLDRVWYDDLSHFYGTYNETMALLNSVPQSTVINGTEVNLRWRAADIEEVVTLDFTDQETRSSFVPLYHLYDCYPYIPTNGPFEVFGFTGRAGEPYDDEFGTMTVITNQIWVRQDDPDIAYLNYTGDPRWRSVGSDEKWEQWVIAEIEPAPTPTPEPGTILLLGAGLAGLAGFRKRVKKQ